MDKNSLFDELKELLAKVNLFHVSAVLFLSVVLFLISFIYSHDSNVKSEKCTAIVYGTVSDVKTETNYKWKRENGRKRYYSETITTAYISVETDETFTRNTLTARDPSFIKGEKVTIHYDPDKPDRYYLNNKPDSWNITPVIASVLLVLGLFLAIRYYINKKAAKLL